MGAVPQEGRGVGRSLVHFLRDISRNVGAFQLGLAENAATLRLAGGGGVRPASVFLLRIQMDDAAD